LVNVMNECFLRFDNNGLIEKVYFWNMPVAKARSVYTLFDEASATSLYKAIQRKKPPKTLILSLEGESYEALLKPIGRRYLLYMSDQKHSESSWKTVERLIEAALAMQKGADSNNEREKIFYYESIQELNNELTNKSRELEKLNKKLNRANKILNNHLVTDPLTGLVSRYQYRDEMAMKIKESPGQYGVFCFLDIDDFKSVNDNYGHATGDRVLIEFAKRLKGLALKDAIIMRIAGDEFGLFVAGVEDTGIKYLETLWEKIRTVVHTPIPANGKSFDISISVGFAVYGKDTKDIHLLIDYADFAMYQAKQSGKNNYAIFDKNVFDKRRL